MCAHVRSVVRSVAGDVVVNRISWEPDPVIIKIVESWPVRFGSQRAHEMGFEADADLDEIIRGFIDDDLGGHFVE